MKLNRKLLKKLIQEEIENLTYDRSKNIEKYIIDFDDPFEVETHEDAWAGGRNIYSNADHLKDYGSKEKSIVGIERLVHKTDLKESSLTNRELRTLILEEIKKVSELTEFINSRGGKKFLQAGRKIESAGTSIRDLGHDHTGIMRETLYNVSEFVEKLGHSIGSVNELDEDSSTESTLPTVAELKKLIKSIKRLEK